MISGKSLRMNFCVFVDGFCTGLALFLYKCNYSIRVSYDEYVIIDKFIYKKVSQSVYCYKKTMRDYHV